MQCIKRQTCAADDLHILVIFCTIALLTVVVYYVRIFCDALQRVTIKLLLYYPSAYCSALACGFIGDSIVSMPCTLTFRDTSSKTGPFLETALSSSKTKLHTSPHVAMQVPLCTHHAACACTCTLLREASEKYKGTPLYHNVM